MLRRSDKNNFVYSNNVLFMKQREKLLSSIFTSEERMLNDSELLKIHQDRCYDMIKNFYKNSKIYSFNNNSEYNDNTILNDFIQPKHNS